MSDQSRESEKQILTLKKDVEHLQYIIDELEKECEFVKNISRKKILNDLMM